jgi:DNA-binding winged helix-turn-helix (wHTH) protein
MAQASIGRQCVRFGVFEVDLDSGELRKHGIKIKLQQKPFQILSLLLERPGDIVTRQELQRRLWPSDVFVDFESGPNNAVKKLRAALGDSAETPRFIETLAGRGYRFLAIPLTAQNVAEVSPPPPARISLLWITAALAIVVGLTGFIWAVRRRTVHPVASASQIHRIAVLPLENLSHDDQQEYFADRYDGRDYRPAGSRPGPHRHLANIDDAVQESAQATSPDRW